MSTRRDFLSGGLAGAAAVLTGPAASGAASVSGETAPRTEAARIGSARYRPPARFGLGGVAIGNGFAVTPSTEAEAALRAAWAAGTRYYDTSPWYGLGLGERRFGQVLFDQDRDAFAISTKVGRVLHADPNFRSRASSRARMWKGKLNFGYTYDYTASGTRRSIEDSLQRLGLSRIDMVFIHDLTPESDLGENWREQFAVAAKGAMPELTRMREEGVIKAWGLGVNLVDPCLMALDVADPDLFLCATQYSLIYHDDALGRLFPACDRRGVSVVLGAPLNAGFLAGVDRYNYGPAIPPAFLAKREQLRRVTASYGTDLRVAALQFCAAPKVVSAVIPGARTPRQARENVAAMTATVPQDLWTELKQRKLIAGDAPTPA